MSRINCTGYYGENDDLHAFIMIFWDIGVFVIEIVVLLFIGLNKREMTSIIEKNTSNIIRINFNFSLDNERL